MASDPKKPKLGAPGHPLDADVRQVIFNAHKFGERYGLQKYLSDSFKSSHELTAAMTGVSTYFVWKVLREAKDLQFLSACPNDHSQNEEIDTQNEETDIEVDDSQIPSTSTAKWSFNSPKRCSKQIFNTRKHLNNHHWHNAMKKFDKMELDIIRNVIHEFWRLNQHPTLSQILANLRQTGNTRFVEDLSKTDLWRIIRGLGFKYGKLEARKIIVERREIVEWRTNYLRKVKELRESGVSLVFIDETWFLSNMVPTKSWKNESQRSDRSGPKTAVSKGSRIVAIDAIYERGFVPEARKLFGGKCKTADFHGEMNSESFLKWFEGHLLNSLDKIRNSTEEKFAIVMDNATFHCAKANKAPSYSSKKAALVQWLTEQNIQFEPKLTKPKLYQLIRENKGEHEVSVIEQKAIERGYEVVRLPPYHCNLNPIEYIWAIVKGRVRQQNTYAGTSIKPIMELAEKCFQEIPILHCKNAVQHVIKEEAKYWELDKISTSLHPTVVITVENDTDSDFEGFEESDFDVELFY